MAKLYLAGPDVFLPHPEQRGALMKSFLAGLGLGLEGVFPLDADVTRGASEAFSSYAGRIRRANLDLLAGCDGVLANLSPFRGPSADDGTAYECGFARGRGLPVFAWSADAGSSLVLRTWRQYFPLYRERGRGLVDRDGYLVEDFALPANLMLVDAEFGGLHASFGEAATAAARHFAAGRA